jgi:hypothetical protein
MSDRSHQFSPATLEPELLHRLGRPLIRGDCQEIHRESKGGDSCGRISNTGSTRPARRLPRFMASWLKPAASTMPPFKSAATLTQREVRFVFPPAFAFIVSGWQARAAHMSADPALWPSNRLSRSINRELRRSRKPARNFNFDSTKLLPRCNSWGGARTPNIPHQPTPGPPIPRKRRKSRNRLRTDRASRAGKVRSEQQKKWSPSKMPSTMKSRSRMGISFYVHASPGKLAFPGRLFN